MVREDWDGENEDDVPTPSKPATKVQIPEANVSRKIETNTSRTEPVTSTLSTPQQRKASLSPSRSARFSNRLSADMEEGQRHDPPPRSVSPRKPALKHAPSPVGLATERVRDHSASPSEATDTSTEGRSRRKKAAHVTFNTQPAVVGISAEPETPVSPTVVSPQYRDKTSRWTSMTNKNQHRSGYADDSDEEDAMKPTPALPTFGSVRGQRSDVPSSNLQKIASSPSASSTSSVNSNSGVGTMNTSISSDHALGGLLAREQQNRSIYSSVTVPHTDSKTDSTAQNTAIDTGLSMRQKTMPGEPLSRIDSDVSEVPSIAVLPATPGTEEELKHKDQWLVSLPGEFPDSTSDATARSVTSNFGSTQTPSSSVAQDQLYDYADVHHDRMPSIQEEDTDKESIYSDAAEDLTDTEGDGFGSINAIVRSPVVTSPMARSTPPDSPATAFPQRDIEKDTHNEADEWTNTGARWRENTETAKRASLHPAAPIAEPSTKQAKTDTYDQVTARQPRLASSAVAPSTLDQTATPATMTRTTGQSAMKKSMRSGVDNSAPRTMRTQAKAEPITEGTKPLRSSMRTGTSGAPAAAAAMSSSSPPVQGTLQKRNLRTTAPPVQQRAPAIIDDDTDSDGSFRRRRRARANNNTGGFGMRKSMRSGGGATAAAPAPAPAPARAMSPTNNRPASAMGSTTMRSTMRGSSAAAPTLRASMDNGPTLRGKPSTERRSSSLFGRGKDTKSSTRPMSMANTSRSRFGVDSDDERVQPKKAFRSRFGDSSDEEEDMRPVRGIPRKNRDDDSTDLDDSSDDEKRRKKATIAPAPLTIPERPTSPMSMESKKKRGLFSRFKKNGDEPASPTIPEPVKPNGREKPPKKNAETAALGFQSDAQKEALIEQTRQKLLAANGQQQASASPQQQPISPPPTPGKLQRRQTPQRIMSDSWPLPPKIPDDEETPTRPYTSDGPVTPDRPILGRENSSATAASSPTGSGSTGKAAKKKRFPLLRKAFGLKD